MASAPVADASRMIISFWFRDPRGGGPPPSIPLAGDMWTPGGASMVPPNAQYLVTTDVYKNAVFYINPYGFPPEGIGGAILGGAFLGPLQTWTPNTTPIATNDMHMLLTFGDPNQSYDFTEWRIDTPGVIKAVYYSGGALSIATPGIGWQPKEWPPPYAAYFTKIGDAGKFTVQNIKINDTPTPKDPPGVPQSFIGVDKDGNLTICLQTKTKATYKGYAFQIEKFKELWATATYLNKPTGEAGFWLEVSGYWNGYEFEYKDISQQVMGAQPECFLLGGPLGGIESIGAPVLRDGSWHHVLFSFDISGSVTSIAQASPKTGGQTPRPVVTTSCQAWLAVDDTEYTGNNLQHRPKIHDGLVGYPKLPGTVTTEVIQFGPMVALSRDDLHLGSNDIIPQNVWLIGKTGNPREGLRQCAANSDILISAEDAAAAGLPVSPALKYGAAPGDFNPLDWTGKIWTLYGHGVAPGPWLGSCQPPRPTVPNPLTFDLPTYTCSGFSLPLAEHPIGIPASSKYAAYNTGVEMAELQIWIGQSTEAGQGVRRLFIDKEGRAVSPKKAEEVLGKPDIKLHGSANWKQGKNTGTTGSEFRHVAGIEKFTPDPKLNK